MKRADTTGKRVVQAVLLVLSAFLLLLIGWLANVKRYEYDAFRAAAPDVQVTLQPGLPDNWLLNAADADTLDMLPGIGEVLAERIVNTRSTEGLFFFPEDLVSVKGIGKKTLADIILWLEEHPEWYIVPRPQADGGYD